MTSGFSNETADRGRLRAAVTHDGCVAQACAAVAAPTAQVARVLL